MADKTTVAENLSANAESAHALACNKARTALLARYGERVADDRTWLVDMGRQAAELVALNLSIATDEPSVKDHRAQSTRWIADRIAETYGDAISADEWIAVNAVYTLAKPLTASVESSRVSGRFLRIIRKWVARSIVPAAKGFREEWAIRPGFTEYLRSAFDNQAKAPVGRKELAAWMGQCERDVEQTRINGIENELLRAKVQAKVDAKNAEPTEGREVFALTCDLSAADAMRFACAVAVAGNLNAALAMSRVLGPFILEAVNGSAGAVVLPTPAPTLVVSTPEIQARQVA